MASIFFYSEDVIMIDHLEKTKTISGQKYASKLGQLKKVIKSKRRGKLRAGKLLLQDKVLVHIAQVAVAEIANCGFELLDQVGWGCRIHRLHLCRGVRPPPAPTSVPK